MIMHSTSYIIIIREEHLAQQMFTGNTKVVIRRGNIVEHDNEQCVLGIRVRWILNQLAS
jgi:hypothetical protein